MLNRATLIGHLGDNPNINTTSQGDRVAHLSIATSERWKDKATGEKKERTEWHRVTVWNEGLVKVIEQYVRQGSRVYIEGQLQTRKWQDKNGVDHYTTEIVLKPYRGELVLLDSKSADDTGGNQTGQSTGGNTAQSGGDYASASGHYGGNRAVQTSHQRSSSNERDIPF